MWTRSSLPFAIMSTLSARSRASCPTKRLYDSEWLDGETAIFNCHSHIILYDFAADTGRVLDDMTQRYRAGSYSPSVSEAKA